MSLSRIISTCIFLFLFFAMADASTKTSSQSNSEIEKLNQQEQEFQFLIKEAKEILSNHSVVKEEKSHSEIEQKIDETPQIVLQTKPEPPVEQPTQEIAYQKAEPSIEINQLPQPTQTVFVESRETPWTDPVHQIEPDLCYANEPCSKASCAPSPCPQTRLTPCLQDSVLLYADVYLGNRPSFDESIYTGGLMYFENSLSRNGITIFVDVNGSYFQHDNCGVTAGIGSRFDIPCSNTIIGVNAYFDYVDSDIRSFRQAGIGFEWINCSYSIRANGYIPAGKDRSCPTSTIYDDYVGDYIVEVDSWVKALQGYDVEFRKHICLPCDFWMYPTIGAYYLTGDCCSKLGAMGGLAVAWRNIVSVEGTAYYDKCNRANGEARLSINLPLEYLCRPSSDSYCPDYSKIRVRRRNYIPTERVCQYITNY